MRINQINFIVVCLSIFLLTLIRTCTFAQVSFEENKWTRVALNMPDEWYASDQALRIANDVIDCQKSNGGWAKNRNYHNLSIGEKADIMEAKYEVGATIDNHSTITELRFLARVYSTFPLEKIKLSFDKGLRFLLEAQYENGGWPQFYPPRSGVPYSANITYNDGAMVNVLIFLNEIFEENEKFNSLKLTGNQKDSSRNAFMAGIDCILKTQIIRDGKRTVWCAQHDQLTLAPSKARSYELASYSGAESAEIVLLLMDIEGPSDEIKYAVEGAVEWFELHKIEGIKLIRETNQEGLKDWVVVPDETAKSVWGRFYDLETEKPFFCDRDGVKKETLAEIGFERRNGYGWYTLKPQEVLDRYTIWKNQHSITD